MSVPADSSEAALMQRLAGGEDLALNELMHLWSTRITAFLARMTGDVHAANDLAQETFVRVYRHRKSYRATQAFSTWIFHIAANLARNHARWRSRHPESLMAQETLADLPHASSADSPDEAVMREEQASAVRAAVLALPDELREPLVLSVYESLPHVEIAAILELSAKAVEMRLYRARQLLKEQLMPGQTA